MLKSIKFLLLFILSGVFLTGMREEQSRDHSESLAISVASTVSKGFNYLWKAPSNIIKGTQQKYNDIKPIINIFLNHRDAQPKRLQVSLDKNPTLQDLQKNLVANEYSFSTQNKNVKVALSKSVCNDEARFIHAREAYKIVPKLEHLLNRTLRSDEKIPRIALIGTGGGCRAQIIMLGALEALYKSGLLDTVMYIMGLSGSTGALFPYIAHAEQNPRDYIEFLRERLSDSKSYHMSLEELESFHGRCLIAEKYELPQGLVCSYGASLANAFLSHSHKHHLALSDLWSIIQDGDFPMPIGVAVDASCKNQMWVECTPCRITQIGSCYGQNLSIPSASAGSIFSEGSSILTVPSLPLSDFLGMWWSAFSISHGDIMHELPTPLQFVYKKVHTFGNKVGLLSHDDSRVVPYTLPNFAFGVPGALTTQKSQSQWIDGGFKIIGNNRHNFASVPALWRNVDIMIMVDSNKNGSSFAYLTAAADQARELGYKFPHVTEDHMKDVHEYDATVLDDKDDETPIVVYIKIKENQNYNKKIGKVFNPEREVSCGISQFTYTKENFDLLCGLSTHITQASENALLVALFSHFQKKKY